MVRGRTLGVETMEMPNEECCLPSSSAGRQSLGLAVNTPERISGQRSVMRHSVLWESWQIKTAFR